jgi:sugar phosphate isomerase/epimerase
MQRRKFLETSGWLALAALAPVAPAKGCEGRRRVTDIGIQVYTLRDAMQRDPEETLRQVSATGYTLIEGFGYHNGKFFQRAPATFRRLLDSLGLRMVSSHVGIDVMRGDWEMACAHAKEVGQEYIVLPWLLENERKTLDDYRRVAELLNRCAEVSKRYGLQMAYHNHDFEFIPVEGKRPLDLLLEETDDELVKFELDQYWIRRTLAKAEEYYAKYPGRFHLWHVKDMEPGIDRFFAPVGDGTINWPEVFAQRDDSGLRYFFVEQDAFKEITPMDSAKRSYAYLRDMRY